MRKIPTVLARDPLDRARVLDEVTPGCEWVLAGEGVATRKYDGTCVMLDEEGQWWARREVKPRRTAPDGFVAAQHDDTTGKTVGWEPVAQSPFARFHTEALSGATQDLHPGTYELCGPKVQSNPERFDTHVLIRHADAETFGPTGAPRNVAELKGLVAGTEAVGWEGAVWHHPDGRMAKLKRRDLR